MTCQDSRRWLDAYIDGELDLPRMAEIEEHLRGCPSCGRARDNLLALRKNLVSVRFTATEPMRQRMRAAIRRSVDQDQPARTFGTGFLFRWLGVAAAMVFAFAFILLQAQFRATTQRRLLDEITDSHLRSLTGAHLVDVVSANPHVVRPWFEGKVDFAPPVPDISTLGFTNIGGRLDFIDGHAAAALVYQVRLHYINVIIRRSDGANPAGQGIEEKPAQRGYNIFEWTSGGLDYWAVSEINARELRAFAEAFQQEAGAK